MNILHTELPWRAVSNGCDCTWDIDATENGSPVTVATVGRENAEFIIRACNAHGDLVRELMHALCFVEDRENCTDFKPGVVTARIKSIRAALAKAGAA